MQVTTEEQLQFDIGANLKRGFEYVGGHVKITNENVYFSPHSFNVQKKDLVISIEDIEAVDTAKILGLSPNGVVIHLKDGTDHKFTIGMPWGSKNKEVVHYIDGLLV